MQNIPLESYSSGRQTKSAKKWHLPTYDCKMLVINNINMILKGHFSRIRIGFWQDFVPADLEAIFCIDSQQLTRRQWMRCENPKGN